MAFNPSTAENFKIFSIDHTKIDSSLSNYPIAIRLDYFIPELFLSEDENKLKIAAGTADGNTQYYIEIECWEIGNHTIHIKIPSISDIEDTEFTFFWDFLQDDNTSYVGVIGSANAQNVWDSDFTLVYHMSQDPLGVTPQILDSTSNENHGDARGTWESSDLINALIGKAIVFNGSDNGIITPNLGPLPNITVETFFISDDTDGMIIGQYGYGGGSNDFSIYLGTHSDLLIKINNLTSNSYFDKVLEKYGYVAASYNHITFKGFIDDVLVTSEAETYESSTVEPFCIGVDADNTNAGSLGNWLYGAISEIRISNIAREDAWIKATYFNLHNDLFTEEISCKLIGNYYSIPPINQHRIDIRNNYFERKLTLNSFISPKSTINRLKIGENTDFDGVIKGIVLIDGLAVKRPVILFDHEFMRPIKSIWSNASTGEYEFINLNKSRKYTVICIDNTEEKNAVIADWVTPDNP